MNYVIAPAARRDIDAAAAFYAEGHDELGLEFILEIQRIITLLKAYPGLGRRTGLQHRRFPLTEFPYFINYRIDEQASLIRIIAVSHQKRRPGYWADRVEEQAAFYIAAHFPISPFYLHFDRLRR
jgi:toxin ParE1/3/4